MDDIVLLESVSLRKKLCIKENLSVLEKVGQLILLPNTGYATTESLAAFYQVPAKTIRKLSQRHKGELEEDGYNVLSIKDFRERHGVALESNTRFIALYPRKACLRVGMLLVNSEVAQEVRSYLLRIEERSGIAPKQHYDLVHMAEALQQHAIQIGRHSDQLISQAGLIKAIVDEINRHDNSIKSLKKQCDSFGRRIFTLEQRPESVTKKVEYITAGQLEVLRVKVKQLGKPVTIWKRLNKFFGVSRYKFLPGEKFQEALDWLESQGKK